MIKWNDGTDTGLPLWNFPKAIEAYEIDVFSFGAYGSLWAASITTPKYFPIVRDHFRTQEEALDFVASAVTMLEMKYPNAVCNNFSFLNKE